MIQTGNRRRVVLGVLLWILLAMPGAHAAEELSVKAWLGSQQQSEQSYSVRQQVILVIDVGTTRWFTGGTQISAIDVPNLMSKQRNTLATNYTERIDDQTWSRQHWELTLYPQVSGDYVIPPIAVTVTVSGSDGKSIEKTLYTQPLSFSAQLPSGELTQEESWLASPQVTVKETWTPSHDELHVGDSVTRRVTINAVDTLSVLIPAVLSAPNTSQSAAGYQSYPKPPTLIDTQNRGSYQSSRHEEVTYVLQHGGEVQFPEQHVLWWNTQINKLEQVTLPAAHYRVKHTMGSWLSLYGIWIVMMICIVITLVIAVWAVSRFYRDRPLPMRVQFRRALKHQQWPLARTLVYRKLRHETGLPALKDHLPASKLPCANESKHTFIRLWNQVSRRSRHWSITKWLKPLNLDRQLGLEQTEDKKNGA
ncbi:hypothetical protein ACFSJQ_24400 [Vibrio olivae]|uniref:Protein BatD n=1 Tax=Vibrio olivae TaxID=1243002 RepID=A0ABV5HRQ2_9VIBR